MDLARLIDRLRYAVTSPGNFLRLAYASSANRFIRLTALWGEPRAVCNLCGWKGRRFAYFLEREFVIPDSQCPGCGSLPRNRLLIEFIGQEMNPAGKTVLDVAPAPGYKAWFEARGAHYLSIDFGGREAMARMDATRMGFADQSFDLIIISHVLEHVPDYKAALSELRRVLDDEGTALIDVPFSSRETSERLARPDHQGHFHRFGKDVVSLIEEAGFIVEVNQYSTEVPEDDPDNQFFLVRKSGDQEVK